MPKPPFTLDHYQALINELSTLTHEVKTQIPKTEQKHIKSRTETVLVTNKIQAIRHIDDVFTVLTNLDLSAPSYHGQRKRINDYKKEYTMLKEHTLNELLMLSKDHMQYNNVSLSSEDRENMTQAYLYLTYKIKTNAFRNLIIDPAIKIQALDQSYNDIRYSNQNLTPKDKKTCIKTYMDLSDRIKNGELEQ